MNRQWLLTTLLTWTVVILCLGLRLLLLGGAYAFGGPLEPPSHMSWDEYYSRTLSGQWLRDEQDQFAVAAAGGLALMIAIPFAALRTRKSVGLPPNRGFRRFVSVCGESARWTVVVGCVLAWVLVYWRLRVRDDPEGNAAALAACVEAVRNLRWASHERGNEPVTILDLGPEERRSFARLSGIERLPQARVWVRPLPVTSRGDHAGVIIAVCDQAFDNVPRRILGQAPRTHAAAYADGSTELLTVEQFKRLDLRDFVDLREIISRETLGTGVAHKRPTAIRSGSH